MSLLESSRKALSDPKSVNPKVVRLEPKKGETEEFSTLHVKIEPGIYQHRTNKNYFERPWIEGKRTWRALKGKNLKLSREEYYRRKSAIARGERFRSEGRQALLAGWLGCRD